jgi:ankyrin repeat protein
MSFFISLSTDLKREIALYLSDEELNKIIVNFLQDEDDVFWKMRLSDTYYLSNKKVCTIIQRILKSSFLRDIITYGLVGQYMVSQEWDYNIIGSILHGSYISYLPENLNVRDKNSKTMLMFLSSQCRDFHAAKRYIDELIKAGADVNLQYKNGTTALMMAVQFTKAYSSEEIVKSLINGGADVNIQDKSGLTALMLAARFSNTISTNATVKMLIDAGADMNLQTHDANWTALMYATRYSDTESSNETAKMLIEAGAVVNKVDKNGNIAVIIAAYHTKTGSNDDTIKMLLDAGSNVNHINYGGFNIISFLTSGIGGGTSSESTLDLVLTYKPDVNIVHPSGKTNLIYCIGTSLNCSIIIKLIQAGADVNTFSHNMTPLMYAIQNSTSEDIIKLLTHPNIDVSIKNNDGDTAYDLSVKKYGPNHPVSRMLKSY